MATYSPWASPSPRMKSVSEFMDNKNFRVVQMAAAATVVGDTTGPKVPSLSRRVECAVRCEIEMRVRPPTPTRLAVSQPAPIHNAALPFLSWKSVSEEERARSFNQYEYHSPPETFQQHYAAATTRFSFQTTNQHPSAARILCWTIYFDGNPVGTASQEMGHWHTTQSFVYRADYVQQRIQDGDDVIMS